MSRFAAMLRTHALPAIILLSLGFALGWFSEKLLPVGGDIAAIIGPGIGANEATPADLREQFGVFWEAWNLVENEFYHQEPLDRKKMIQGAIKGMLGALDDPYTVYQEPNLAALTTEHMKGSQEGIGVYLRLANDQAFIDRPIKNSPATKAGLQAGDEILAIDGVAVGPLIKGLDINKANVEIATRIRGPKGSQVTLTIRRGEAAPFDLMITRDEIAISSVSGQILPDGVAYVRISEFTSTTTEDFDTTMAELLQAKPTSFVLDLRNNPGGYLINAQEVLGRFYDGVALYQEDATGSTKELPTITSGHTITTGDLPMVVLVNANSASASEIVAGALRDKRPATYLLGEKTYGKGSVQNIHALSDTGSARITFAHWLTPNHTAINKIGITPEFIVPYNQDADNTVPCVLDQRPVEGQAACADSQLAWSIRFLTNGEQPPQVTTAAK